MMGLIRNTTNAIAEWRGLLYQDGPPPGPSRVNPAINGQRGDSAETRPRDRAPATFGIRIHEDVSLGLALVDLTSH